MAARHVPVDLDVAAPWTPLPGDGYLDFMTPTRLIRFKPEPGSHAVGGGGLFGEEHTGRAGPAGKGVSDHPDDNHGVAGDRADFDWVQEHRPDETGATHGGTNHPGPGALGWRIAPTAPSPHVTAGEPHRHSAAETPPGPLPELPGGDFQGARFGVVDVFSAVLAGEDADEGGRREAALDYELWFVDLERGTSTHGVPTLVFAPGWTAKSASDDFVARWTPATPGSWNGIVIDPPFGFGHDKITEIDAVRAAPGLALMARAPPRPARHSP